MKKICVRTHIARTGLEPVSDCRSVRAYHRSEYTSSFQTVFFYRERSHRLSSACQEILGGLFSWEDYFLPSISPVEKKRKMLSLIKKFFYF
jgi:hypothetical protein